MNFQNQLRNSKKINKHSRRSTESIFLQFGEVFIKCISHLHITSICFTSISYFSVRSSVHNYSASCVSQVYFSINNTSICFNGISDFSVRSSIHSYSVSCVSQMFFSINNTSICFSGISDFSVKFSIHSYSVSWQ